MSKTTVNAAKAAEGEQHKQRIYDCLVNKSMSRRECYETVNLTRNQFTHYIKFMIKECYVKTTIGKCQMYKRDKVHILTANLQFPYVARTKEQIQAELDEKIRQDKLVKPHTRVIKLINTRPYNFHKADRKKQEFGIQSSFNIL